MIPDEFLRGSIAASAHERLWTYPAARPLPAQRNIVDAAIRSARRYGLRLPATVAVRWVSAPGQTYGQTRCSADGSIEVTLNVDVMPAELERVALHELKHCSDLYARLLVDDVELEQRAIAFAAHVLGYR